MNRRALAVWCAVAGVAALGAFQLFHSIVGSHALAIMMAGLVGIVTGSLGYRWTSGDVSRGGLAMAGALGGLLGLAALHLLPLLH